MIKVKITTAIFALFSFGASLFIVLSNPPKTNTDWLILAVWFAVCADIQYSVIKILENK